MAGWRREAKTARCSPSWKSGSSKRGSSAATAASSTIPATRRSTLAVSTAIRAAPDSRRAPAAAPVTSSTITAGTSTGERPAAAGPCASTEPNTRCATTSPPATPAARRTCTRTTWISARRSASQARRTAKAAEDNRTPTRRSAIAGPFPWPRHHRPEIPGADGRTSPSLPLGSPGQSAVGGFVEGAGVR
ncbi:hypothetical protein P3T27_002412 [Kitasatospora sp. MAA19]|nr:hypothetical protein [Kitasatospora sp. MAA19]